MNHLHYKIAIGLLVFAFFLSISAPAMAQADSDAASVERISPEAAKAKLDSGEAIMVCSYDDQRCAEVMIEGAITKGELSERKDALSKDQELIFYCA